MHRHHGVGWNTSEIWDGTPYHSTDEFSLGDTLPRKLVKTKLCAELSIVGSLQSCDMRLSIVPPQSFAGGRAGQFMS